MSHSLVTLNSWSDYGTKFKTDRVANDLDQENFLINKKHCPL